MSQLGESLKVVLADTFALYLKTHFYHFNVEGEDFYEYHKFFNKLYDELFEAFDAIGEHIRSLDEYAPASLGRFSELTNIEDAKTIPSGVEMTRQLLADNQKVIESLKNALTAANEADNQGAANFIQDRLDIHAKHGWMLRATTKNRL